MEQTLYPIGKAAEMMGIQAQLLRYYCDMGLVTPEYIDPSSGYRYFSFQQFSAIDRTRFLLRCGLHLKDIRTILRNNDLDLLVRLLTQEKQHKEEQLQQTRDTIDLITWYINYFTDKDHPPQAPYEIRYIPRRYLLAVRCPEHYRPCDFYSLFSPVRQMPAYRALKLTRQVTVALDYQALLKKELHRYYVGEFIMCDHLNTDEHILEIPGGEYYCFRASINDPQWDPNQLRIPLADKAPPLLTLASEYEKDFKVYNNNPHEVQILFGGP